MNLVKTKNVSDISKEIIFLDGRIHVLSSRPEIDKTIGAINFIKLLAQDKTTQISLYYSIELSKEEIEDELGVSKIRSIVIDLPRIKPSVIGDQIKFLGNGRVDWVVIDYFQLMNNNHGISPIQNRDVTLNIFEDLNGISKNQNVKFLILHQLPRSLSDIHEDSDTRQIAEQLISKSHLPIDLIDSLLILLKPL